MSLIYDVRLIYCFEKKGVLENVADDNSAIKLITKDIYIDLKERNNYSMASFQKLIMPLQRSIMA